MLTHAFTVATFVFICVTFKSVHKVPFSAKHGERGCNGEIAIEKNRLRSFFITMLTLPSQPACIIHQWSEGVKTFSAYTYFSMEVAFLFAYVLYYVTEPL